jgi:hypothetical protein
LHLARLAVVTSTFCEETIEDTLARVEIESPTARQEIGFCPIEPVSSSVESGWSKQGPPSQQNIKIPVKRFMPTRQSRDDYT